MNILILEVHRKKEISLLNHHKYSGGPFYVVPAKWYKIWLKYLKGGPKPSRILIGILLDSKGAPKANLVRKKDYWTIPKRIWEYLKTEYGSDTQLECSKNSIYTTKDNNFMSYTSSRATSPSITHKKLTKPFHGSKISIATSKVFRDSSTNSLKTLSIKSKITNEPKVDISQKKKAVGIVGLKNTGCNCYMNAILQCLLTLNPFIKAVASSKKNTTLVSILKEFFIQVRTGIVDCKPVIDFFRLDFPEDKQHDAPEFLRKLIDSIDKELAPKRKTQECDPWRDFEENHSKLVVKLFCGMSSSKILCLGCRDKKEIYECFNCLTLEVTTNLTKSLEKYFDKEIITDQYYCRVCEGVRTIEKQYFLINQPNILIIQLKRFVTVPFSRKINMHCNFDLELELRNIRQERVLYRLRAIAVHTGSWNSGHYTAYCYRDSRWYFFDDAKYSEVEAETLKEAQAYLLIYTIKK